MRKLFALIGFLVLLVLFMTLEIGLAAPDKEKPKSTSDYFNTGLQLENARMFVDAVSQFDRAISRDPDYLPAYIHKGLSLIQIGRYREAIEAFNQVLVIKPDYTDSYIYIARAYIKQGDQVNARKTYQTLLALDKEKAKALLQEMDQQGITNKVISKYSNE